MTRPMCLSLVLAALVGGADRAAAQTQLAPLYSLPKDGTWVEYDWKLMGLDKKEQTGVLRISSVGTRDIMGVPHRWVEIKLESRQGEKTRRLRKLLVAEDVFAKGQSLSGSVVLGFDQGSAGDAVARLSVKRLSDFFGMGISGPNTDLKESQDKEEVKTALGKFVARHVSAGGDGAGRAFAYHGWLTQDVPFGWVKFEIHERPGDATRIVFTAIAARRGQGAQSELDESKIK